MCHYRFRAQSLCMLMVSYTMNVSSATKSSRHLLFAENKVLAPLHDAADRPEAYPARGLDMAAVARKSLRGKVATVHGNPQHTHGEQQPPPSLYQEPDTVGTPARMTATEALPQGPGGGYPRHYPLLDVIRNWSPDNTSLPERYYDSMRHFDYSDALQRAEMLRFREAEVPFVVHSVPTIDKAVRRWTLQYMAQKLGKTKVRTEVSDSNHHMYFRQSYFGAKSVKGWHPPMRWDRLTFEQWLRHANVPDAQSAPDKPHWYFRMDWKRHKRTHTQWVYDDLEPVFGVHKSDFIVDPHGHRGINCRAGMRGVLAEAHFDSSRNFIVMLKGAKRYILAEPRECQNLHYYRNPHPSARHTAADFSDISSVDLHKFPRLRQAKLHEVVLHAGEMLYLPTYWNHNIVSLGLNLQCNTRSGVPSARDPSGPPDHSAIRECM